MSRGPTDQDEEEVREGKIKIGQVNPRCLWRFQGGTWTDQSLGSQGRLWDINRNHHGLDAVVMGLPELIQGDTMAIEEKALPADPGMTHKRLRRSDK